MNGNYTPFDTAQGRLGDGPRNRDLLRVSGNCLLKTITEPLALRGQTGQGTGLECQ